MAPMTSENTPLAPPPRGNRRDSSSEDDLDPGRDISDDDDDFDDNDTSESESDLEIPPDPIHEERMQNLRREHAFLLYVTSQQDAVLEQMRLRISEIQSATERRRRELEEFREVRRARRVEAEKEAEKKAEEEGQGGGEGCQPPEGGNDRTVSYRCARGRPDYREVGRRP